MENDFFSDFSENSKNELEVPKIIDTVPDGKEAIIIGDPEGDAEFSHLQGDNSLGFEGTCGLCSIESVLQEFGVNVDEEDVVRYADNHDLCNTNELDMELNGGTTLMEQAEILDDYGVPSHTVVASSLEDVSAEVEDGHGVIIAVNAGILWDDPNYFDSGEANHAVTVTGVARDLSTGETIGYYINDSGKGEGAQYVTKDTLIPAFLDAGGGCVITDVVR